jgi:hypothetical protein
MSKTFEVIALEDGHPLHDLDHLDSYGFLMEGINHLDETPLLDDVKAYHVNFFGGEPDDDNELWANPLRAKILQRLTLSKWHWYLSFIGDMPVKSDPTGFIPIEQEMQNGIIRSEHLDFVVLKSPEGYANIRPRLFVEIPEGLIFPIIQRYWHRNYPGYPIQGLLMGPGQAARLQKWSEKTRNAELFREIIDEVYVTFYAYPSENRHFYFLTNKLSFDEFQRLIDMDNLQKEAVEIGNTT